MLGEIIHEARVQRGISLTELARALGLSVGTVCNLENDRGVVSEETLKRVAVELNLDSETLYFLSRRVPKSLSEALLRDFSTFQVIRRIALLRINGQIDDQHLTNIVDYLAGVVSKEKSEGGLAFS